MSVAGTGRLSLLMPWQGRFAGLRRVGDCGRPDPRDQWKSLVMRGRSNVESECAGGKAPT